MLDGSQFLKLHIEHSRGCVFLHMSIYAEVIYFLLLDIVRLNHLLLPSEEILYV